MVFFTCNVCNESLKKNQVEKHYKFKCRNCEVLTCVDCQKEFWGTEYEKHVKCITENEKYGGKNYVPKPGANKGEQKQEAWCQHVQAAARKASTNHKLKAVLDQVANFDNVPRKKAKYENFLKNSMRIQDYSLITKSWELISAEIENQKKLEEEKKLEEATKENIETKLEETSKDDEECSEKKLNKRERKEERQKKGKSKKKYKHKKSNEEESVSCEEVVENGEKKGKKRKKLKDEDQDSGIEEPEEEQPKAKKTKKSADEPVQEEDPADVTVKFSWELAILTCLKAKNGELALKKLKKKVMAEFWNNGGESIIPNEEKALAKFHKKLLRIPKVKVHKERVEIVE